MKMPGKITQNMHKYKKEMQIIGHKVLWWMTEDFEKLLMHIISSKY